MDLNIENDVKEQILHQVDIIMLTLYPDNNVINTKISDNTPTVIEKNNSILNFNSILKTINKFKFSLQSLLKSISLTISNLFN